MAASFLTLRSCIRSDQKLYEVIEFVVIPQWTTPTITYKTFHNGKDTGASLVAQMIKKSACHAGDSGSIPGLGRSHGEGSVQFSCSVVSDSLRPHESQHARPPCSSPTPGVHSDSCSSSWWCHPAISSSVIPFSSCPQSLPASESVPMSQLFTWGGQSTGVSALASFLPKKSQGWSPLEWTDWISLQSKGLSRVFSNTTVQTTNSSILAWRIL